MSAAAVETYRTFLDALNRQDLDAAAACVDRDRYREDFVGLTHGFVGWDDAVVSVRRLWRGVPDVRCRIQSIVGDDRRAAAHLTASGTHLGALFGLPATRQAYEVSLFDAIEVDDDGRIVERVQQADNLGMVTQLLGRPLLAVAAVVAGAFGVRRLAQRR